MFGIGKIVGLAEWITDDTCLVVQYSYSVFVQEYETGKKVHYIDLCKYYNIQNKICNEIVSKLVHKLIILHK